MSVIILACTHGEPINKWCTNCSQDLWFRNHRHADVIAFAAQEIDRLKKELAESQAKCDHADELLAQSLRIEEKVRAELVESQVACAAYRAALEKYGRHFGECKSNLFIGEIRSADDCTCGFQETLKSDAGKKWIEAVRMAIEVITEYGKMPMGEEDICCDCGNKEGSSHEPLCEIGITLSRLCFLLGEKG